MPGVSANMIPGLVTIALTKPGVLVTDLRSGDNPEGEQTYPYFEDGELHEMPLTVAQQWAMRVAEANRSDT